MLEGYIVYESFYYASEYIKKIDDRPGVMILDDQRNEEKGKESYSKRTEKGA